MSRCRKQLSLPMLPPAGQLPNAWIGRWVKCRANHTRATPTRPRGELHAAVTANQHIAHRDTGKQHPTSPQRAIFRHATACQLYDQQSTRGGVRHKDKATSTRPDRTELPHDSDLLLDKNARLHGSARLHPLVKRPPRSKRLSRATRVEQYAAAAWSFLNFLPH